MRPSPTRSSTSTSVADGRSPTAVSGHEGRGAVPLRLAAGAAALVGLLLGAGGAGPVPLDDAQEKVEQLLMDEPGPVARLIVTQDRLFVAQNEDGRGDSWELFPERVRRDPYDLRLAALTAADFPVAETLAHAETLASNCDADTYEVSTEVVSGTATLTQLSCGEEPAGTYLNDQELQPLHGGWTVENLSVVWNELEELAPEGEVRELIFLNGGAFVVLMPEPGLNAGCRIEFSRKFENPSETIPACTRVGSPPLSRIDLGLITPERLGATIARTGDGVMAETVLVATDAGGHPEATVFSSDAMVTVPIQ